MIWLELLPPNIQKLEPLYSRCISGRSSFYSLKNGVKVYLRKSVTRDELIDAIMEVYNGNEYFNKEVSGVIIKNDLRQIKDPKRNNDESNQKLTPREQEILKMVAQGFSNQLFAEKLFISVRTVESHKNHIMQKLEFTTTVDLVKYAKNALTFSGGFKIMLFPA